MFRYAIPLLALSLISTTSLRAETFASQIRSAKHFGLSVDRELAAFTLYVYTPSQYEGHVASLESFRRDLQAFKQRMVSYDRERQEAQKRRAGSDELNAITLKKSRENSNIPTSPFEKRITLSTLVSSGDDYIAISPLDEPNQKLFIPFDRVGRVIVTSDESPSPAARGVQ